MKKVILSLVIVFGMSSFTSPSVEELDIKEIKLDKPVEVFGCLTEAYNGANKLEANSEAGEYSWDIETWSGFFNQLFEICNAGYNVDEITNIMID